METRKLYYEDSHCREFTANVVSCEQVSGGYAVELDATAFYPEGGGQACDLGKLNEIWVLDVREKDGKVQHLCEKPLPIGSVVTGKIDWLRRLDLMQQHTGEHIVSGIINRLFGCHNVGFHVGGDVITIDFDTPVPPEALTQIEEEANQGIYENLPVRCWYPDEQDLAALPYRTKKQLAWPVRIVEIPGYDRCACCGVHVKQTGEVGIIKLLSCVKFHQGVRIEMVCGRRALALLGEVFEQNRQVSQAFSAKMLETGSAARRMNDVLGAEKLKSAGLQRQLFDRIAADHRGQKNPVYFDRELTANECCLLADKLAKAGTGVAAVFSGNDPEGYTICLMGPAEQVSALGQELKKKLSARGGGKPGVFQGTVKAERSQLEHVLVKEE